MTAIISIVALTLVVALLLRENRRLTNLVVAKNPDAVIAAEKVTRQRKKEKDDRPRATWSNPSEAVGP